MNKAVPLLLAALCFAPASAFAAATLHCADRNALRKAVTSCDGNDTYSAAARVCEEGYEASVKAARTKLASSLARVAAPDKQSKSMDNAKASYDQAIASLDSLVALGGKLKAEILAYKDEVVLPEDFGAIGETGFSTKVFLDNNPCYKSTQDLLSLYADLMGSRAEELQLTSKIASALAAKAFRGEMNLKPGDILPLLTNPAPAGGAKAKPPLPGRTGKSSHGQSDITGTGKKTDAVPGKK